MSVRLAPLPILLLALLVAMPTAHAGDPVTRFELDNGLDVMVRPVHGSANATIAIVFDVGELHDPVGKSGLAHFVEHCYVTCAAGDAPLRTAEEMMTAYPDGWNAQTGRDYTIIAFVTRPKYFEREIRDAAWRMGDLHIRERDLERERPRVLEELANMYDVIPNLAAANRAAEMIVPSPQGASKGGVPAQVDTFTVEDLKQHYERYYKPKNARLAITGAIDAEETRRLVRKYFGRIASGEAPPAARAPAPSQTGVRKAHSSVPRPGLTGFISAAYAAPAPDHEHYAPFLVFVGRAFGAANRKRLPPGLMPVYSVLDAPHVLQVTATLMPAETSEAAVERVRAFVETLAAKKVSLVDRALARQQFGMLLGTSPVFEPILQGSTYPLALGLLRRDQMGIDGPALGKRILAVEDEAFRAMAEAVLTPEASAVVVMRVDEP